MDQVIATKDRPACPDGNDSDASSTSARAARQWVKSPGAPVVSAARAAACLPMAYATYVACTRVVDYKHRPADVIAGALIGAVFAWACAPRHLSGWGVRLAKPADETNRRPV